MREVDVRLDEIDGHIAAVRPRVVDAGAPRPTISGSVELDEVMLRTLAATHAIKDVDGGRVQVRRPTGRSRRRPRASSFE